MIAKFKGDIFTSEKEILEQIKESDYSGIFESIVLSNRHLRRRLDNAYHALDKKEELDKILKEAGIESYDEIGDKLEEYINKIKKLKSGRNTLFEAVRLLQEENQKHKQTITEKDEQINKLTSNIKNLIEKVSDMENKIQDVENDSIIISREVETEYESKIEQIKKEFNIKISEMDQVIKQLERQFFEAENDNQLAKDKLKLDYNRQISSYEAQIELLQNSYKEIYSDSMKKDKAFKETIKEIKKQNKREKKETEAAYQYQRETFNNTVLEMKKKSEQDHELTEKLTRALQESENKVRELYSYMQKLESSK